MLQVITVTIDVPKVQEFGTLIIKVVPPSEKLPQGSVLLHEQISLPGFKYQVTEDKPTVTVMSRVFVGEMPAIPKQETPPAPEVATPPAEKKSNVLQGIFGKGKNKKRR